ncbi:hypothetical protein NDU88_001859 [Pleurodeles waltl]|uniref:Uncharacterized protein n=1 Tax=Pleurodeles waltl TaxID=8319 RepID=A0AAV7WJL2_PLEWA|nr:hypothetical protein NDU88_001859 [Pleurodeles waltl]
MSTCSHSFLLHEPELRCDPRNFVRHFIFSKPVRNPGWGTSPRHVMARNQEDTRHSNEETSKIAGLCLITTTHSKNRTAARGRVVATTHNFNARGTCHIQHAKRRHRLLT